MVGVGRLDELPSVLVQLGTRALVCTGSHPDRHESLIASLGLPCLVFPADGEPTVEAARAATSAAREYGVDVVVAIGGGSVMDLGKAVAMLLANGGDPLDYLEVVGQGQKITQASIPNVAVPTTAGTGSEVTANAVLTSTEHNLKASLRSPLMTPHVALVDPLLTVGCPPSVTASSGLDALTQCLEPFVSIRANPLTDSLAREGLRRTSSGLRRAYSDGSDVEARTDMALGSLLGGMALANAKLGAVHGFAGVIGGALNIPHGMACAALLAPVVEANVRALRSRQPGAPALARYEEAARVLTDYPDASIEDGVAWIREALTLLAVPGLAAYGLRPEHADDVIAQAAKSSSMQGNPVLLNEQELRAILAEAT
jgi:alcohol dehydrogenase class IV